jgi:uncharacterized protein YceH (UPF0502 family)
MNIQLTPEEARIIGCLLEKAVTTPDQYPLTLNALTNACNQKSSRNPVMTLHQGDVQRTVRELKDKHFVSIEQGFKNDTEKYTQRLCNTLLSECQFDQAEYAIVCLLLLRGPQTPGELRSRSGRLHGFEDNNQVVESLKALMDREGGPVVARLPRQSGRMDHEYAHLFSGDIESTPEEATVVQRAPAANRDQQISKLEDRLDTLEKALIQLAEQLGEEIDLGD